MSGPVLSIEGLVVGDGAAPRLGPVDFSVAAGQALAVLGPNGAGKSTLLRTIVGLERPAAGRIAVSGQPLPPGDPLKAAALGVGYAPEGRRPFPGLTTEENLTAVADVGRALRGQRLEEAYALFPRLAERRRQEAWRLSGGEQQMLAIARALMRAPKLLLLDEPSLGLAPMTAAGLFDAIAAIRDSGVAILLAGQNIARAAAVADHAAILVGGHVVAEGPPAALGDAAAIAARYLGRASTSP